MNDELEDLIQRALDGDASAPELRRLEAALAADPKSKRRYDELSGAFQALATARMVEPPHGLSEDILDEIRRVPQMAGTGQTVLVPTSHGSKVPAFRWQRLVLPGVASVVAVAALWLGMHDLRRPGPASHLTGAFTGSAGSDAVRFGEGTRAVSASWEARGQGFWVRFQTGDAPVTVECVSVTPGVRLALSTSLPVSGGSALHSGRIEPHSIWLVHGVSAGPDAELRAIVEFPGGHREARVMKLAGLSPG